MDICYIEVTASSRLRNLGLAAANAYSGQPNPYGHSCTMRIVFAVISYPIRTETRPK